MAVHFYASQLARGVDKIPDFARVTCYTRMEKACGHKAGEKHYGCRAIDGGQKTPAFFTESVAEKINRSTNILEWFSCLAPITKDWNHIDMQ